MVPKEEPGTLSPDEFVKALGVLTPPQKGFLMKWANIYAVATDFSPDELLSVSVGRPLAGQCHCARVLTVLTALKIALRSTASDRREEMAAWHEPPTITRSDPYEQNVESDPFAIVVSDDPPPDAFVEFDELVHFVKSRFEDDNAVQDVLEARLGGFTKDETCELLGMPQNDHDAAVKRLRRAVEKEYGR